MLVRPVATNKRAFYLMNTTQVGAQLYELVASSTTERKTWLDHINAASNAFKTHGGKREFRPTASLSSMSFSQGQGGSRGPQAYDGRQHEQERAGATGRSQSFNEQSLRQREAILNRPLPSPPIQHQPAHESLEKKIEKLTRKDEEVARALEEKQKILADIFEVPPEDYDSITDLVVGSDEVRKDAKDVLLAVMSQADTLARCVNDCLRVSEEREVPGGVTGAARSVRLATPPSDKLLSLTSGINTNLTALLTLIQDQEEERQGMRRELLQSQERIREMVTGTDQSFSSRPMSFISLESEDCSTPGGLLPGDCSNQGGLLPGDYSTLGGLLPGDCSNPGLLPGDYSTPGEGRGDCSTPGEGRPGDPSSSPAGPSSSTPVKDTTPTKHVDREEVEGSEEPPPTLEAEGVVESSDC